MKMYKNMDQRRDVTVRLPMRDNATGDNFLSHFVRLFYCLAITQKPFTFTYIMIAFALWLVAFL